MSDLIDRQSEIDAVSRGCYELRGVFEECEKNLNELPSAEPKIIHCEECAHGVHSGRGDIYLCTVSPEEVREHKYDFYCGYADRRTD